MAGFVVRGPAAVLKADHHLAFGAEHDPLERVGEVGFVDDVVVATGCKERSLVDEIREIRPDHAGGRRRDSPEVDVRPERHVARVHAEDRFPAGPVGRLHRDPAVETSGSEQGLVEDVGAIGRTDDDHVRGRVEPVHLGQDLIQGLLAFVVAAAETPDSRRA